MLLGDLLLVRADEEAGLSGALAAAAVGTLRADLLLYPLYFSVINTGAALVISLRQLVVPYVAATPRMPRLLYITPTSSIYTSAGSRGSASR